MPSFAEASERKPRAAQTALSEAGITGEVLTPEGGPATQGTVVLMMSSTSRVNAPIDRKGQFRILPDGPGWQRIFISVPGFAPYRATVTVPQSRTLKLPPITLLEPSYFHARFVTKEGEPLAAGLRRQAIDMDGGTIVDPLDHVREQVEADGSLTIGPLWPGRTMLVFNRPPLAQTRLRDVNATGKKQVIEGGTIAIGTGAQLHVDIFDAAGRTVPRHDVWIEDAVQPSPLFFTSMKTNRAGSRCLRASRGRTLSRLDADGRTLRQPSANFTSGIDRRQRRRAHPHDHRRPRLAPDHVDARSRDREDRPSVARGAAAAAVAGARGRVPPRRADRSVTAAELPRYYRQRGARHVAGVSSGPGGIAGEPVQLDLHHAPHHSRRRAGGERSRCRTA